MPSSQLPRDQKVSKMTRDGGQLFIALDGPPGEACHIFIGIEDLQNDDTLTRKLSADVAENVADALREYARVLREGK